VLRTARGHRCRGYTAAGWLDRPGRFWSAGPMHRRHKTLIAVGLVVFLLGWLAWSVLLTESELVEPAAVQQGD